MTFDTTLPQIVSGFIASILNCSDPHFHCLSFSVFSQLLTAHVGFVLGLVVILAAQYANSPWRKVPPGPKGLPILGNALQLNDKRWMFEKDCKRNFRMSNPIFTQSCDTTSSSWISQKILCI